jgi:citrate synthase
MGDAKDKTGIGNLDSPDLPFDYGKREYGTVPLDHGNRAPFQWVSEVSYKNVHRIVVRGYDTTELMEEGYGVPDVLFVIYQSRIPLEEESKLLDYVMIMALEDGLSAPAAISRIVAQSKTFLTQAAGASILAFGHAYGAYVAFGARLKTYLEEGKKEGKSLAEVAELIVRENLDDEALGVSELMLKDPAAKRMIARAEKLGLAGEYIALTKEITKAAQKISSKPVDLDMLGATGATMMDLGFTPEAIWGIMACTRAIAAGAHFIEEVERVPYSRTGQMLTPREDYDGPEDREVPDLGDRAKNAKSAQTKTVDEWKKAFDERKLVYGSGYSIMEETEDPSEKTGIKKVGRYAPQHQNI